MAADRTFPPALAEVAGIEFPYDFEDDVDFEPYDDFVGEDATLTWLRRWTRNHGLDSAPFLVFGRDGTGGRAAFWLCRGGEPPAAQPVAVIGSGPEFGIAAADLGDFLWLLADGSGPFEAVGTPERGSRPRPVLAGIARRHSGTSPRSAADVIAKAGALRPGLAALVELWTYRPEFDVPRWVEPTVQGDPARASQVSDFDTPLF